MTQKAGFWIGLVATLGLASLGCDSSSSGGTGGSGGMGMGGSGGGGTANVTAVHLAPEVPTAEDTAVALFVDGTEATDLGTLTYGNTTGRIALPAATYDIGIGLPGGDAPLLQVDGVELNAGDDLTVVAYRTNDALPVNVFVFSNSTDGLAAGSGRVFVAHGANDSALNPVNISTSNADGTADCMTLIPEFAFATTFPADGVADLAAGSLNVGFDTLLDDMDACPQVGPVPVPVTADVVSILVAVDENTVDGELSPELWGIVDADTLVRLINP